MPTPLIVAAPLRPGLRSVDEQGRFIEAAEVFELKGEAKVKQKVRQTVVDGSMTAAMQVTDEVLHSSIKMSKAELKALQSVDLMSKVGIEHVGSEGSR